MGPMNIFRDALVHLTRSTAMSNLMRAGKSASEAETDSGVVSGMAKNIANEVIDAMAPLRAKIFGSEGMVTATPVPGYEKLNTPLAKTGLLGLQALTSLNVWR